MDARISGAGRLLQLFPLSAKNRLKIALSGAPAIWHDPGDIKSKDLLNGPGR